MSAHCTSIAKPDPRGREGYLCLPHFEAFIAITSFIGKKEEIFFEQEKILRGENYLASHFLLFKDVFKLIHEDLIDRN